MECRDCFYNSNNEVKVLHSFQLKFFFSWISYLQKDEFQKKLYVKFLPINSLQKR